MTTGSHGKRVLVVAADPRFRQLAEVALVAADFQATSVAEGEAAVAALEGRGADVVLVDGHGAPGAATALCARLRGARGGGCAALLFAGPDRKESIERAYAAGASDYLAGPLNWETLAHRVRYAARTTEAIETLWRRERLLANAQRLASFGSWEWVVDAERMQLSEEACRILALSADCHEVPCAQVMGRIDRRDARTMRRRLAAVLRDAMPGRLDLRADLGDGSVRFLHVQAEPVLGRDGSVAALRGIVQDVTDRKLSEDRIRRLALFDSLTGLPNRKHLRDYLDARVAGATQRGTRFATLFLDLDRFKRINDSLGHSAGDKLLCEASARLTRTLRATDWVLRATAAGPASEVARLGGDEFTIVLDPIRAAEDVGRVAQRVLDALSSPYFIDGYETTVTGSMGIAIFPEDGRTAEDLLRSADTAMYAAKDRGKNNFQFFDSGMNSGAHDRLFYETELRRALERREFLLHYQPRVESMTGLPVGLEALMRWANPLRGIVPPGEFITAAEESGLIVGMTEWALHEACRSAKLLRARTGRSLRVAVNVSPACLRKGDFVEMVEDALKRARTPPELLELEVTESLFLHDLEGALKILLRLKSAGVSIALDDFGTGYSSLSYLRKLPVDVVKIDRSFVAGIGVNTEDSAIVAAIVAMTSKLGLPVVAEGVETQAQAEFLRAQGCQEMQGYLFGRPVALQDFLDSQVAAADRACAPKSPPPAQSLLQHLPDAAGQLVSGFAQNTPAEPMPAVMRRRADRARARADTLSGGS